MAARVAVVTGGGSGIGRGIALALARRGVDVALIGRRAALLEAVAQQCRGYGVRAAAIPADLTDLGQCAEILAATRVQLGSISILVNNAGNMCGGPLASLPAAEVAQAVALNLTAPLVLTRHALPDLAAQQGAVVLVASMASLLPLPYASVYTATKTGLHGFAASLRYELEPLGVRLCTAYPPATATAMTAGMAQAAAFPQRMASPEQVGENIVAALVAGRREVHWRSGEHLAARLYQLAPWLVRRVFASQRGRFERAMVARQR